MVAKVLLEVDTGAFGEYARCNVQNDTYSCECGGFIRPTKCTATLGRSVIRDRYAGTKPGLFSRKWSFWKYNTAMKMGGTWYSTLSEGECHAPDPIGTNNCTWRVVSVPKRVTNECLQKGIKHQVLQQGSTCFNRCVQPLNATSACYIDCYYETLLGPQGGSKALPAGADEGNVSASTLVALWKKPFESDDPKEGGCPRAQPPGLYATKS